MRVGVGRVLDAAEPSKLRHLGRMIFDPMAQELEVTLATLRMPDIVVIGKEAPDGICWTSSSAHQSLLGVEAGRIKVAKL